MQLNILEGTIQIATSAVKQTMPLENGEKL